MPGKEKILQDKDKQKLDSIVEKMIQNNESDDDIDLIINDYKDKYGIEAPALKKKENGVSVSSNGQLQSKGFNEEDQKTALQRFGIQSPQELFETRKKEALKRLIPELHSNDDVFESELRNQKLDIKLAAQTDKYLSKPRTEMSNRPQGPLPQLKGMPAEENPLHVEVTPEEHKAYKESILKDPLLSIKALERIAAKKPQKANQIYEDIYAADAFERANEDPTKATKILKNIQKIREGELITKGGQLIKPEGFWSSAVSGWKEKEKLYEFHDQLRKVENDAALISIINDNLSHDPDEPVSVPKNKLAMIGSMAGSTPFPGIVGGVLSSALGAPEASPFVAAALNTPYFKILGEAAGVQNAYRELIAQGVEPFEALQRAKQQGKEEGNIDAAMGAVFSFIGAGAVQRNIPKLTLGKEFTNTVVSTLQSAAEGGSLMGLGQLYKNYEARKSGIERDLGENVGEQIGAGALFGGAVKLVMHGFPKMTKKGIEVIKQTLRENPENIDAAIGEQVLNGEIKAEEAPAVKEKLVTELQSEEGTKSETIPLVKAEESSVDVIKKAIDNGELKGVYKLAADGVLGSEEAADQFLKDIADQALNKVASEATGPDVNPLQVAKESFGESIVELAIKKNPKIETIPSEEPTITENIKPEEDAISIESSESMDVPQQAGDGKALGEGNPQPEIPSEQKTQTEDRNAMGNESAPKLEVEGLDTTSGTPPPNGDNVKVSGDSSPEMTNISNAVNDAFIEGKFGSQALDSVVSKLDDTDFSRAYNKIKESIQKGIISLKNLRERVITTKKGTSEDQAALLYDMAELKNKERALMQEIIKTDDPSKKTELQNALIEVQNDMMDNALANRALGRDWYHIGMIRQQWVRDDFSLDNMTEQYKAAKGVEKLTPEQETEIREKYEEMQALKIKLEEATKAKDEALSKNAELAAENQKLKELLNEAKKQKQADRGRKSDEKIKKSNERIGKAREDLRKLGGNLNAGLDPRVAAALVKIASEKVYQGIVKIDELVRNVFDEIKDILPHFTEEDVRNHLFPNAKDAAKKYYALDKDILTDKGLKEKVQAYKDLQKEYAMKLFEWQKDRRVDMMEKRPFKEKLIDNILRWQRFAVLSYPSTMVKLAAVVGHQITLKPLKFLLQTAQGSILPKNISSKQTVWGNPTLSALGKYYSALIRNFSLANLKEQFSGIDTKEILYGKGMNYEEWAANKGLLEMPGRSHGYIKSFIKNPEFQFAHEMQTTKAISKMAEIAEKLKDQNLTAEERIKLEDQYAENDITNDAVLERINKLALEHGKWGILMNDNKFVSKFQKWADKKDALSALVRSEVPIIKIPVNYVSRAFATKYGLIKAITGSKWMGGNTPGIMELIFKGTKELTEEQANLLGKTLTLGSMGAAFFGLGYFLHHKIKENEDGSIDIAGVHISKNLVHSPELESILNGAITAQRREKDKGWISSTLEADYDIAKKMPFNNLLTYGFIPNVASALLSKSDTDKKTSKISDAIARKITDMGVPGFVKQSAQWMDTDKPGIHPMGDPIKRKPQGTDLERFWQTFEMAIPGLRKNVPQKEIPQEETKITNYKKWLTTHKH